VITEQTTPGGAVIVSECIATHRTGNACWQLWRDTVGGANMGVRIQLKVVIGQRSLTWREGAGLTRPDCPLEFLERSRVVDREWRDRVWQYWESRIAPDSADADEIPAA
jgi:hypothetical protein